MPLLVTEPVPVHLYLHVIVLVLFQCFSKANESLPSGLNEAVINLSPQNIQPPYPVQNPTANSDVDNKKQSISRPVKEATQMSDDPKLSLPNQIPESPVK